MDLLIDTNILCYWSGIENSSDHPSVKISQSLQKRGKTFVSQWSLVEILVSDKFTIEDKKKLFQFLSNNLIPVLPCGQNTKNLIPLHIFEAFDTPEFNRIISAVLQFKTDVEIDTLNFIVESLVACLGIFYEKDFGLDTPDKKNKYSIQMAALIKGNRNFINQELENIIRRFSIYDDDSEFKKSIESIILPLFYITSITYNSSLHNIIVSELSEGPDQLSDSDLKFLRASLENNPVTQKIFSKLNHGEVQGFFKSNGNFQNTLTEYKEEMKISMNPGFIEYIAALIEKIFVTGKKITQNDLIDSLFLARYPACQIITADKKFKSILKIIDESQYDANETFLKELKE